MEEEEDNTPSFPSQSGALIGEAYKRGSQSEVELQIHGWKFSLAVLSEGKGL